MSIWGPRTVGSHWVKVTCCSSATTTRLVSWYTTSSSRTGSVILSFRPSWKASAMRLCSLKNRFWRDVSEDCGYKNNYVRIVCPVPPHLSLDPAVPRHEVRALVAGAVPHAQVELAGHEVGQVGVTHLQTELVSICV